MLKYQIIIIYVKNAFYELSAQYARILLRRYNEFQVAPNNLFLLISLDLKEIYQKLYYICAYLYKNV